MNTFEYVRPATVQEAVAAASEPGAAFLAAGTNLLDLMKGGITRPSRLVDISHLPELDRIEDLPDGSTRIGALVRNADLAHDPNFARRFPAGKQLFHEPNHRLETKRLEPTVQTTPKKQLNRS